MATYEEITIGTWLQWSCAGEDCGLQTASGRPIDPAGRYQVGDFVCRGSDFTFATDVIAKLDAAAAGGVRAILVKIDSRGGSARAGFAVYDRLRRFSREGGTVVTFISGLAASTAATIAVGGDHVVMAPDSTFGFHGASGPSAAGKEEINRRSVDLLCARSFAQRTAVEAWHQDELHHFVCRPKAALGLGLCDAIGSEADARALTEQIASGKLAMTKRRKVLDERASAEATMGFVKVPVRILEIVDNTDGTRDVTAEAWPLGIASAAALTVQRIEGVGYSAAVAPGPTWAQMMVPPVAVTNGQVELWIAASGSDNWGGCEVWVSRDGGSSYSHVGTIRRKGTFGTVTSTLTGVTPSTDTSGGDYLANYAQPSQSFSVDVSVSGGELLSVSSQTRDAMTDGSLCWLGCDYDSQGELVAYKNATLTGPGQYTLSDLLRAQFGTPTRSGLHHYTPRPFIVLNDAVCRVPFPSDSALLDGSTALLANIKLRPFNIHGGGQPDLSSVPATQYSIRVDTGVYGLTGTVVGSSGSFEAPIPRQAFTDYGFTVTASAASGSPPADALLLASVNRYRDKVAFAMRAPAGSGNSVSVTWSATPSGSWWRPLPAAPA